MRCWPQATSWMRRRMHSSRCRPPLDVRRGEHGGWPGSAFSTDRGDFSDQGLVKDISGENHQVVQGLPRAGGRPLALGGQIRENALHLRCPERVRLGLAAALRESATAPVAIGLRGAGGVARRAKPRAYLVHPREARMRATWRCIVLWTFHILWHSSAISGNQQENT
jgi:hypothetical protein